MGVEMRARTFISGCDRWLLVGCGLIAWIVRLVSGPWPIDDAYITFRYARNLANGLGLVYNPGQFVLGTSTPVFAFLLAVLFRLTRMEIPWLALIVGAVADGAATSSLYYLARRAGFTWMAAVAALSLAFSPLSLHYALGGMEVSLVSALLLGAFILYVEGHEVGAAVLGGLAVLTRLDALAAIFAMIICLAWEARRVPWRPFLVLGGILLPWFVYAGLQYGSPFPQSVLAKSQPVYSVWPGAAFLQILMNFGGLILGNALQWAARAGAPSSLDVAGASLVFALPQAVLWGIGMISTARTDRRYWALFIFPVLFTGTYSVLGLRQALLFEWYFVPLLPYYLLGILAGLTSLLRRFAPHAHFAAALTLSLVVVVSQIGGLGLGRLPDRGPLVPIAVTTEREDYYRRAAEFLRPRLKPGDTVAASEIGALGYYCDCRILDTVGLVSPEALAYYPLPDRLYAANYAVPPDLIRDLQPDYIVSLEVFIRHSLTEAEWFREMYRPIWQVDTRVFGSKGLVVFARVTSP